MELFAPYRLIEKIHHGAVATVHRGEGPNGPVAIKHLLPTFAADPDQVLGFAREREIGSTVKHENLVRCIDAGEAGGTPYLVTEYVEGATVRNLIPKAPIPEDKVARMLAALCRGLEALHSGGFVHADVTPANILLGEQHTKLGDFGVAAKLGEPQSQVKGTYAYMSPEQVQGQKLFAGSDLFAVGVIGWELLTGKRLFKREEPFLSLRAVVEDPAPPLPPSPIAKVIMRCLEKDSTARYSNAESLATELLSL